MKFSNNKGFTLMELIIVIAIIAILSTLAILVLGGVRMKTRDIRRVADANSISKALELYFSNNNSYPVAITGGAAIKR